jgi:hypothetical protein
VRTCDLQQETHHLGTILVPIPALAARNLENLGNPAVVQDMLTCARYLTPAIIPDSKTAQIRAFNSSLNALFRVLSEHIFGTFLAAELRVCMQEYSPGDPGPSSASAAACTKQQASGFRCSRAHLMCNNERIQMSSCTSL